MKQTRLFVLAGALLGFAIAEAHTELKSSVPADAATVEQAPEQVQLTFSEPVRLTALSIQKDGEQKQSFGPLPTAANAEFSVALPAIIGEGHYVVTWRALSEDTHVMNGEFMFAVGAEAVHDAAAPQPNAPAAAEHQGHGAAH